jgi:hypothetical protein
MTRAKYGTRHDDAPHLLVRRAVTMTHLLGTIGVAAGWLAFGVAVVRCILSTPYPH